MVVSMTLCTNDGHVKAIFQNIFLLLIFFNNFNSLYFLISDDFYSTTILIFLVLSIKDGPVNCAKVCEKSVVILVSLSLR